MTFHNLARMYSTTTGDSDIVLTTAVPGCKTFADAGVSDSDVVNYGIITYNLSTRRPVGSEVGTGKYIASGTTFQRTTVESSTDSDDSQITLTGLSEVYLCPVASDFNGFGGGGGNKFAVVNSDSSTVTIADSDFDTLILSTEVVDADNIVSLATNIASVSTTGFYDVDVVVDVTAASALTIDGQIIIFIVGTGTPDFSNAHYFATVPGNLTNADFHAHATLDLQVGGGANTILFRLENDTGQSVDAYIITATITQK